MGFACRDGYAGGSAVEYVDLRRRREDHARRKPEASRRSAACNPLFFFGAGFVLGYIISPFFYGMLYVGDFFALLPVVLAVALLCYFLRLPGKRPGETGPEFGSEKATPHGDPGG